MDGARFDALVRTLCRKTVRSRRGVMRTAAGGIVVGLWAAVRGSKRAQAQVPPPLCPAWVLARYPWLCEGNAPNTPNNSNNRNNDDDNDNDEDKDEHHDEDPDAGQCGPFVEPCPGNPQCGSFGRPCPGDAQCVAGTCGGSCPPSTGFECLGTRGGECCAGRDDCCWCLNTATNESYGYCTSAGSPCSSGAEFGSGVTCARV